MNPEPENKVLPFKHREPLPMRWTCPPPCNSKTFTLWTDGRVYCAQCRSHHYKISFAVDESALEPAS